ncbi:MAG: hypothetical protein H0T74_05480 [Rubrobacteraceae bacterium]|nr:hypothetical protein [Rubrobacteraceae bacterium]
MSRQGAVGLAWSLGGLSVAMFVASAALAFLSVGAAGPFNASEAVGQLLTFALNLAFPIVGTLIAARRPENPIGWISLTVGLFWILIGLKEASDAYAVARFGSEWSSLTFDALIQWLWVPPVGLLGIYMILLFPDGKLPTRRWRPFAWFGGAVIALICVLFIFVPGPLVDHEGAQNPLGLEWLAWVADVGIFIILLLPLCILASALSLVLRYRRSEGEVREQIKWLAFAACFIGVTYTSSLLVRILFAPESLNTEAADPLWLTLVDSLNQLSYAGVPVAIGFAVLKYRLYDIDILINRTLVYGSLTLMLGLVYFGSVTATQALLQTLTGQQKLPQLAIVVSTLVIAALFNPLRRRIQSFIDRRFYRRKYDAAKTLGAFSARLREETDLSTLSEELVGVVRETMQPEHVSLWLRPDMVSPGQNRSDTKSG